MIGNYRPGNYSTVPWEMLIRTAELFPTTAQSGTSPQNKAVPQEDLSGVWWQQPRPRINLPSTPHSVSQQVVSQEGEGNVWWKQLPSRITSGAYLLRQSSNQQIAEVELWQEYDPQRQRPYCQWTELPRLLRQPSQRWDALPDVWQEWEAFMAMPFIQSLALPFTFKQPSQSLGSLTDDNLQWWEQSGRLLRAAEIPSLSQIIRQSSQLSFLLSDYNSLWWKQFLRRGITSAPPPFAIIWSGLTNLRLMAGGFTNQKIVESGLSNTRLVWK